MWPSPKKQEPANKDPYWDYLDVDKFLCGPDVPGLTADELNAVRRGLAGCKGYKLHPEIARDTFGAFAAAALTAYASEVARGQASPDVSVLALQKALSMYPHPLVASRLAAAFDRAGRAQEAQRAREEGARMQRQRRPKDTDLLLEGTIKTDDDLRNLLADLDST